VFAFILPFDIIYLQAIIIDDLIVQMELLETPLKIGHSLKNIFYIRKGV